METKTYEYIVKLYPDKEKRRKFISLCALTYGLQLSTLSDLLGIDIETLRNELYTKNNDFRDSMDFLFQHGTRNQELGIKRFTQFFSRLYLANRMKDKNLIKQILLEIYDKDAKDFREKHLKNRPISDDEIKALITYQIKYGMSILTLTTLFNISRRHYPIRVSKYFNTHPEEIELKEDYEYLLTFFTEYYGTNRGK